MVVGAGPKLSIFYFLFFMCYLTWSDRLLYTYLFIAEYITVLIPNSYLNIYIYILIFITK